MDEFRNIFWKAKAAQAAVKAAFGKELPRGESVTLGTVQESLEGLDAFLKIIAVLVESGLRPMLAARANAAAAANNVLVVTEPLRKASAKLESARRIMQNLNGCNCALPVETVTRLSSAIQQARALAERL